MKNRFKIWPLGLVFFSVILSACSQNKSAKNYKNMNPDSSLAMQSDSFWKNKLSDQQYYILREKGTERPYTGKWLMHEDSGVYTCSACGNELFYSNNKFDSHCGWPSFDEEIKGGKIITETDNSLGMSRTEIMCGRCKGHLGHLFDDGPTETGKRYCVNSVSLEFVKAGTSALPTSDTLTIGGGCFWCIEAFFDQLKGVQAVVSGYSGGETKQPSYAQVCSGNTGHAEVVQIIFNPQQISLQDLLKVFFKVHDPTTYYRQGADIGSQYRSIILYRTAEQKMWAEKIIQSLSKEKAYSDPIVTEVRPFTVFYKAEISHQDYYANNPEKAYCKMVIQPKLIQFEKAFQNLLK